jgi:Bacterial Ig-like domain (group 3)
VSPSTSGTPSTGSNVDFYDGTTKIGSGLIAQVSGKATATYTTVTPLALGSHTITAKYTGDGNYNISTSPAIAQFVGKQPKALAASVPAVTVGTAFALTISAVDALGVATVAYNGPVTVTVVSGPGIVSGTLNGTMVNGMLVLSGLTVNAPTTTATPYVLKISASGLPDLTFQFTAIPPPPVVTRTR